MSHFNLPAGVQWGRDFEQTSPKGNVFRSMKTQRPIEFRRRWHLDGLRILSVDPEVKTILPYVGCPTLAEEFETPLIVTLTAGQIIVGFSRYPTEELFCGKLPFRCFTRTEVEAEPQASTTKAIWSAAGVTVDPADRIRLLRKSGQHTEGLPIAELLDCVKWPLVEPVHAILSLVVEGELQINPAQKLRPETLVKRAGFETPMSLQLPELKSVEATTAIDLPTFKPNAAMKASPATGKRRAKMRNLNQAELLLPITGGAKARINASAKPFSEGDQLRPKLGNLPTSNVETSATKNRSLFRDQTNKIANNFISESVFELASSKFEAGLVCETVGIKPENGDKLTSDSVNDSSKLSEIGFRKLIYSN